MYILQLISRRYTIAMWSLYTVHSLFPYVAPGGRFIVSGVYKEGIFAVFGSPKPTLSALEQCVSMGLRIFSKVEFRELLEYFSIILIMENNVNCNMNKYYKGEDYDGYTNRNY